jgi:hypothetical protein
MAAETSLLYSINQVLNPLQSRISTPRSLPGDASEHSTSASKSSKKSKSLLNSSSKGLSQSSSNGSAKPSSKASSRSSSKSSQKHKFNDMLHEINSNGESNDGDARQTSPALSRYVNSTTLSNPHFTLSSNAMIKADCQAHVQALLDDFDEMYGDGCERQ